MPAQDGPVVDTSEKVRAFESPNTLIESRRHDFLSLLTISAPGQSQVHISSLALLKMLKHGRAGVPMEVSEPGCLWWPFLRPPHP